MLTLRIAGTLAMALMLLGLASPNARAAGPSSLQGEILNGTPSITRLDCVATGTSIIEYTGSGSASGPYPGTFNEQGTITVGPLTFPDPYGTPNAGGSLIDAQVTFTIYVAGQPTVTGTKHLVGTSSVGGCLADSPDLADNYCSALFGEDGLVADFADANATVSYDALIDTPAGQYADTGVAALLVRQYLAQCSGHVSAQYLVFENFVHSDGLIPVASGPSSIALTPGDAVNTVGTSHTVTATVLNATAAAVSDSTVQFSVAGSTNTSGSCTTDAAGQCSFTYNGPLLPGADVISAYADSNGNSSQDAGEPMAEATKAWTLPSSTAGQTTGGGQIWNSAATDKIAFGYNAQSQNNGSLKGNCDVVDPTPANNVKIKCLDVTTLVQSGTHATFFGNATVNGAATTYRIDVDDLGEPGVGHDTFRIVTANGYSMGGAIANGNIQIHN